MKSTFLLLLSFFVFAGFCRAQKSNDSTGYSVGRFSFGFNVGNGYPLRNYANTTTSKLPMSRLTGQDTNTISGYAKPGFHYEVYASYRVFKNISIMLAAGGDKDYYDINTLNIQYSAFFPPNAVSAYTGYEYYVTQFLVGPKLNFPLSRYCSVECKALAGLTTIQNPNLVFYNVKDTTVYSYPGVSAFGYNLGLGFKYVAAEGYIGLHFSVSYAGAVFKYPNYTVYYSAGAITYNNTYNSSKTMTLGILQVAVGISIEL